MIKLGGYINEKIKRGASNIKDQDLLSIKEFSELTGIKQSKLRYYDEISLFQPVKRGDNGYRYYSAPQTIAVNCINVMHSLNIPLKKISGVKKKRNPKQILEILKQQELKLNQELFRLQQAYAIIHTYSDLIQEGLMADEHSIAHRFMTAIPIELGPINDFSNGYFYDSFFKFLEQINGRNINSAYPAGGFYNSMNDFVRAPGQPTRYFSHVPTGRDTVAAGEYLLGYTRGYYGNLGDLPQRMQIYAKENQFTFTGPVYEMYLHDEITMENPDQYLIRASAAVKKQKL